MLYDDLIKGVQSALHRHPSVSSDRDRSRPEPAKGRSTGCHNGKTGTGNVYAQHTSPFDRINPLLPTPMARRKMKKSHLVVACLPIFLNLASAQLIYPNCTAGWDWSYNSLGQNPCNVAAYLEATCGNGLFQIAPLPQGLTYRGPDAGHANLCECNTVVYSLVSACAACQASSWIQWSSWRLNCSTVSSPGTYPNSIPAGTRVPHWAYLDVSAADTWTATAAQSAGDSPEGTPQTVSSTSTSSTSVPSPSSSSNQNSSSAGVIAGGVVGGVAGATLLVALIIWYIRRRRWRSAARPSPFMSDAPHMAEAFGLPDPGTSTPMITKYYDPSDPSTFPTSLASPSATVIQTTPGSEQAHGTATPPMSVNDRGRYNGLPLV